MAAVTAAVVLLGAITAVDWADSLPARTAGADAVVRVVRFTAVGPAVTARFAAYAGGGRTLSVPAGTTPTAGGYAPLTPGLYVVTVRCALPVSPLLTVRVQPGAAYTVGVLVDAGTVQAVLVRDDITAPPPGFGRVRLVLAAAARRATVTVAAGPVLADAAPFGTVTGYHTVRAGSWRVSVTAIATTAASGVPRRPIPRTVAEVAIRPGSLTTLVVADAPSGGLAVRAITDAVGARRRPGGPVPAGGGGMAAVPVEHQSGPSAAVMGVLELLGVFALWAGLHALVSARRRRTPTRGSAG